MSDAPKPEIIITNWGGANGWASDGERAYRIVPKWVSDMAREISGNENGSVVASRHHYNGGVS